MKEIQLTQGKVALVNDEDFEKLNQFKWHLAKYRKSSYAIRNITVNGKQKKIPMHCAVMNGKGIDHIDHNGLNNQRSNLRFCTKSENAMNNQKQKNCTSIYKGVYFFKRDKKWMAHIELNGKQTYLGTFSSEVDAALAYNEKAIELFGEFANLNKPLAI